MPRSVFTAAYASLVEVLVEARRAQGLTQAVLAARLGKPQSFVAKIEGRERRIDVVEFCALAKAMGLEPERLLQLFIERAAHSFDI